MENSITKFKITDIFLTANKLHFFGLLLEGDFSIGDFIIFEKDGEVLERKILNFGTVSNIDRKLIFRLRIEYKNKGEKEKLKNWKPNSIIANIVSL